jgi:hypothetical protein
MKEDVKSSVLSEGLRESAKVLSLWAGFKHVYLSISRSPLGGNRANSESVSMMFSRAYWTGVVETVELLKLRSRSLPEPTNTVPINISTLGVNPGEK